MASDSSTLDENHNTAPSNQLWKPIPPREEERGILPIS
jgi:hypothetical protein